MWSSLGRDNVAHQIRAGGVYAPPGARGYGGADDKNDIWAWQSDNVQMEKKPADYASKLTKLVEKALSDDDEGLDALAILDAVIAGGVDPVAMADMLARAQDRAA